MTWPPVARDRETKKLILKNREQQKWNLSFWVDLFPRATSRSRSWCQTTWREYLPFFKVEIATFHLEFHFSVRLRDNTLLKVNYIWTVVCFLRGSILNWRYSMVTEEWDNKLIFCSSRFNEKVITSVFFSSSFEI